MNNDIAYLTTQPNEMRSKQHARRDSAGGRVSSYSFLLRHAQPSNNRDGRPNGRLSGQVALTDAGIARCQKLAHQPWLDTIQACVVTRFRRTHQTAAPLLAARSVPASEMPLLDEPDYGEFEGRPAQDFQAWVESHGPRDVPGDGGESFLTVADRVLDGLAACTYFTGSRLVVAHGLALALTQHCCTTTDDFRQTDLTLPPNLASIRISDSELLTAAQHGKMVLGRLTTDPEHSKGRPGTPKP